MRRRAMRRAAQAAARQPAEQPDPSTSASRTRRSRTAHGATAERRSGLPAPALDTVAPGLPLGEALRGRDEPAVAAVHVGAARHDKVRAAAPPHLDAMARLARGLPEE